MTDNLPIAFDLEDPALVEVYDELPLWSAPFGLLLLERVPLRAGMVVLEVGCGTGFPLLELAQRLGPSSTVYGIDPWQAALRRARRKADRFGIRNARLVAGDAAAMGFAGASFDLVVWNLGIDNFAHPDAVLRDCRRVLKPGGRLTLTTNFAGHMAEFYEPFRAVLIKQGHSARLASLAEHEAHRSDMGALRGRLERAGFRVTAAVEESFALRFLDGTALLRHHFIRLLPAWHAIVLDAARPAFLCSMEERLNERARQPGELALTVPFGYVEAVKE